MYKKNRAITLFLLMGSLVFNDLIAAESKGLFWEKLGMVAVAVTAGVGACKLMQWCFSETNVQLMNRAEKEYEKALQLIDTIIVFEDIYKLNRIEIRDAYSPSYIFYPITTNDKRLVFDTTYEPALYSLARFWFDRGMSSYSQIDSISRARNELQKVSKKLESRINDKCLNNVNKSVYANSHEMHEYNAMRKVMGIVNVYLPHLNLLADYVSLHSGYFSLFDSEAYVYKKYDVELRIIQSNTSHYTMINDLRQSVLWQYSGRKYPFITFVSSIASDISELSSNIRSVSYHYADRISAARMLLDSLVWIKNAIESDERYAAELYQSEVERLERLRIETAREQVRLEKARLQAQYEQNRLIAQNNLLQAQQLTQQVWSGNRPYQQQVTVVVN